MSEITSHYDICRLVAAKVGDAESQATSPRWDRVCSVIAAGLMLTSLWKHEPWSDEVNAWGLVVTSPTPLAIFHNLAYEGHPGLWYLLLWCSSWISMAPVMLKIVHGTVALGIITMLGLCFPARRTERVLLLLNYFMLYEFAVISRNYGIGLLLALVYCKAYVARREAFGLHALILVPLHSGFDCLSVSRI